MRFLLLSFCFFSLGCPGDLCGDGALDAGESCDDENTANADGCEADCSLPSCNNGILDPNELCFFKSIEVETDTAPSGIVAADLNQDSTLDIVTVNSAGESLGVLLGDGAGGFSRLPDIDLVGAGLSLIAGDFDGDELLDLAAALATGAEVVEVFRGLGDGSFVSFATLPTSDPRALTVGDFNGDSLADIAVGGTGIDVFLSAGVDGFLAPRSFTTKGNASSLVAGDFDGSGSLDIIATIPADDTILILLGDGLGEFSPQPPQAAGDGPEQLLAADFDADGALDLAISRLFAGDIGLLTGDGSGLFSESQTIAVRAPSALTSGDLDKNGRVDVAALSGLDQGNNSHLAILLGKEGAFTSEPLLLSIGFSDPRGVSLADFNADGALDAVIADQGNARLFIFFSQP